LLLEGPNVWRAVLEGTVLVAEVRGDKISDANGGRIPSSAFDTAVQPINGSVGTSGLGDLTCEGYRVERRFCKRQREGLTGGTTGSAPGSLNLDKTTCVGGRVVLGLIVLGLGLILLLLIALLGVIVFVTGGVGFNFICLLNR
jgi:hypothetical protein